MEAGVRAETKVEVLSLLLHRALMATLETALCFLFVVDFTSGMQWFLGILLHTSKLTKKLTSHTHTLQ